MVATNVCPVKKFLEDIISPQELAAKLDEVEFTYAQHYLENKEECGPFKDVSENLYFLRQLRLALLACESK
jgi:hypothetical protein